MESGVVHRMLAPNVCYRPKSGTGVSQNFKARMLLEKVQSASMSMLRTATGTMALRRPDVGACFSSLAGGCLGFSGKDVPLTRAVGVGTSGVVVKSEDVEAVEQFYRSRNAPIRIAMSGLSDESLRAELSKNHPGNLMENWWRPVVDLPPLRIAHGMNETRCRR